MDDRSTLNSATADRVAVSLRRAGWSGAAMLAVILLNGPLANLRGFPSYWSRDAMTDVESYLTDSSSLRLAVVFFWFSTLIFVFAIPFFAGLRALTKQGGTSGLASAAVTIGAALFLAGGLVSEVMSAGMATVVQAAPAYTVDTNAALALMGLQFAALIQGQVGLGVVLIAVSLATRGGNFGPPGLMALGLVAGVIDILRPLAVTEPPIAVALFVPTLLWLAVASGALIRSRQTTA